MNRRNMADNSVWLVGIIFGVVLVGFFGFLLLVTRYKRCASDEILVVFGKVGKNQASVCIHGGARLVWPLFQDYKKLSLIPMTINIPLTNALSVQNIRIHVPSTFTVGVSTDPPERHQRFIDKYGLPFELIADENKKVANKYGVWQEKKLYGRTFMGIVRSTFIIDKNGILKKKISES